MNVMSGCYVGYMLGSIFSQAVAYLFILKHLKKLKFFLSDLSVFSFVAKLSCLI